MAHGRLGLKVSTHRSRRNTPTQEYEFQIDIYAGRIIRHVYEQAYIPADEYWHTRQLGRAGVFYWATALV